MKHKVENRVCAVFLAHSANESLARILVSGFLMEKRLSAEELADIKTAVSEAVTNAVVHAYRDREDGVVRLDVCLYADGRLKMTVTDKGCGIEDVERARTPFFTTDREHERSGMGFAIMETFMDRVRVTSRVGRGTRVVMEKRLSV